MESHWETRLPVHRKGRKLTRARKTLTFQIQGLTGRTWVGTPQSRLGWRAGLRLVEEAGDLGAGSELAPMGNEKRVGEALAVASVVADDVAEPWTAKPAVFD